MTVCYQRKCETCGEYFCPEHGVMRHCDKCRPPKKLMVNNKAGFNKYKKNPKPKVNKIEKKKTKVEITNEIGKLYHKQWCLKKEVLSIGHKITKLMVEAGE